MTRLMLALGLFVVATASIFVAPIPPVPPAPLPKGATARLGSLAFRGPNLNGLTFSPDGKTLRAVQDWHFFAWNAITGRPLPWIDFTPKGVEGLSGTTVIVGNRTVWIGSKGLVRIGESSDVTVVVSDLVAGEVCRFQFTGLAFPGHLEPAAPVWMPKASVTPDGKYLAVWADGDKTLRVYDLDSGKRLLAQKIEVTHGPGVHISPDATTVYFQEFTKPIRRCDLLTGKVLPDLDMKPQTSARFEVKADGKLALIRDRYVTDDPTGQYAADPAHRRLILWDLRANKLLGNLTLSGTPCHFKCVGSDAALVLAGEYRTGLSTRYSVSRWNLTTLKKEWEVPCTTADWLAVSPDGKRFAITDRWHQAFVYCALTGKREDVSSGHDGPVAWVGFSPDGGTITTADRYSIRAWRLTGEGKSIFPGSDSGRGPLGLTCIGDQLAWTISGEDTKTKELVGWDQAKSAIGWRMPLDGKVPDRVYSHDGKRVVGLTWDVKQKRWDVTVYDGPAGKQLHSWTMTSIEPWDNPWPVAFCDAGKLLYVGCREGVIGLDVATGKEKARLEIGCVYGDYLQRPFPLAASADGSRIALVDTTQPGGVGDFQVRVFDVKSGKKLTQHVVKLAREHNGGGWYGTGVRFSPDGKRVAVNAGPGTKVLVCDAESDAKPRVLDGGMSRPTAVAFSPNNAELVVGYQDGTALVWDLAAK